MAFLTPDPRHLDRADARPRRREPGLVPDASYRAWDGSQDVPDLTADELIDALADDIVEHGSIDEALRALMQRGLRTDQPGRGRPARAARPPRPAARAAPGGPGRGQPRRPAGGRPPGARRDRGRGARGRPAAAGRDGAGLRAAGGRRSTRRFPAAIAARPGACADAPGHRREAARQPRFPAARRRAAHPRPGGLRLPGSRGARAVRGAHGAPAGLDAGPPVEGARGCREGPQARGPGGPARDGPRPQRAARAADRRR